MISTLRFAFLLVPLVAALGCARDPYLGMSAGQRTIAQAQAVVGGAPALGDARVIRYDLVERYGGRETSRRNHDWERANDNYSVRWLDQESGETYKVQFKPSQGYKDGTALTAGGRVIRDAGEREKVLSAAWDFFISDRLWLLAPYSIASPDTKVEYVGRVVDYRGCLSERIDIHFDAGKAPHADYRVYIDPNTKEWELWEIPLGDDLSIVYTWSAWRHEGPLYVSTRHQQLDGEHIVAIEKLAVEAGI